MTKVMDPGDAARLVQSGDTVGIGGMILYRRPVGMAIELIRQGVRDLTLLGWTLSLESDLLIGAGCVRRVRTSYFGLESFGMAPMYKRSVEAGQVEVVEETESTLAFGLRAALQGTGFMPARALVGTDILRVRPDIQLVTCPYTGELYPAMPAVRPDVAIIHALAADSGGNAVVGANLSIDRELAMLARTTIISAEEVVPTGELPGGMVDIPGHVVTAVVPILAGSWPTSCYPRYPVDGDAVLDYLEACSRGEFDRYLERLIVEYPPERARLVAIEGGSLVE